MTEFTVIIPTRERREVLPDALETCLRQDYERLRIIVSDNASTDGSREVVEEFRRRDKRVEYINPGERLGMSSHWEFALGHVSSGMVCVIGDDDGLLPDAMRDLDEALKEHPGTQALHRGASAYLYPDLATIGAGVLTLEINPTKMERRNSREWLNKVINSEVWYTELPSIYYGCIDSALLAGLRSRYGKLIHSMTPDGYLAVAAAACTDHYLHLGKPFTITGGSRHSTGYSSNCPGAPEGPIKRYLSEIDIPFHPSLTFVKSIYVLQAEICLQAMEVGMLPKDTKIDWNRMICRGLQDFHAMEFDPAWRVNEVEKLRVVAGQVGVEGMFNTMLDWVQSKEFASGGTPPSSLVLDHYVTPYPVLNVDLRPVKARNIADAAMAAKMIYDAGAQMAGQHQAATSRPMKLLRKSTSVIPSLDEKLGQAVAALESSLASLYASSRWKMAAFLTNPLRWTKSKGHGGLDKVMKSLTSISEKLKQLSSMLQGKTDDKNP